MKKLGGLTLLAAGCLSFIGVFFAGQKVEAAACANVSSFGSVTLQVPGLSETGDKLLWVRMQAADPSAKLFAEVNEADCLEVGGYEATPNQWSWQADRVGGATNPIRFDRIDGNTIRLIGVSDGVKVDRVLLTELDCIPQDFGTNCRGAVELSQPNDDDVTMLPSPVADAVTGKVLLSSTPERYRDRLERLIYMVNGRVLQQFSEVQPFDTSLLANGKYTVFIETKLKDGETIREATVIETKNPENFLTPLMRWIRLNASLVLRIIAVLAAVVAIATFTAVVRRIRRNKRERTFHGF